MQIISESVIKSNTGKTFDVKKGQIIRVIGESTADYVVFNLRDVRERFDQARTKVDQGNIYVTTGDRAHLEVQQRHANHRKRHVPRHPRHGKRDVQHLFLQKMGRRDI